MKIGQRRTLKNDVVKKMNRGDEDKLILDKTDRLIFNEIQRNFPSSPGDEGGRSGGKTIAAISLEAGPRRGSFGQRVVEQEVREH